MIGLRATSADHVATGPGEIRRMPLADGSIAAIDAESELRIALAKDARRIDLALQRLALGLAFLVGFLGLDPGGIAHRLVHLADALLAGFLFRGFGLGLGGGRLVLGKDLSVGAAFKQAREIGDFGRPRQPATTLLGHHEEDPAGDHRGHDQPDAAILAGRA